MRHKLCPTCQLPIPDKRNEIPCSEYHIRCARCDWPVAKSIMDEDGICSTCKRK